MTNNTQHFDLIIVGGGMVGATLAAALAQSDLNIAVVEGKAPPMRWGKAFDLRVSALTRASQNILGRVGAWPLMCEMRVHPYTDMHVWDASGKGEIHFDSASVGEPNLGHIVENRVTQKALWKVIKQQANVKLFCPAQTQRIIQAPEHICLLLEDGSELKTALLVAADGSRSWVRETVDIEIIEGDYAQTAVVANVKTEQHHRDTAWQRFLPTGPLAFLPLDDGYSTVVWSTTAVEAEKHLAASDEDFSLHLAEALGNKLGAITDLSKRAGFPLRHMHAKQYVLPRIALAGDAAHTIHPLAGQGVNLGFADAASLAEVLLSARADGKDIGAYGVLRRYERWRRGENALMLNSMSGFKTLFGSDNNLVRQLRNLGLNLTDRITPVKNQFIRHAMGLSGDLPALAR